MRGQLRFPSFDPSASARLYLRLLADRLEEAKPRRIDLCADRLTFRGGIFRPVSSWNLLVPVTSATIQAFAESREVVVTYTLQMTEMLFLCGLASIVGIGLAIDQHSLETAGGAAAIVWGWLFGGNYLLMRFRMKSLFRKVLLQALQATSSPREQSRAP